MRQQREETTGQVKHATFRFYAELNDFLPAAKKMVSFDYPFELSRSVKDMIEAAGVPHTEVDLILADGESVDFSHLVQDGERVSVYPVFESIDIAPIVRVRPKPLRQTRFVLDTHLGKLAIYLRMMGFDALYRNDYQDEALARVSCDERRILLTRDRELLKRNAVTHGHCLRTTDPRKQLVEVLKRFDLSKSAAPFQRCLRCNGLLQPVPKEVVSDRLQPKTRRYYDQFSICPNCDRVYWKGSHYQRMCRFIERLLNDEEAANRP